MLLTKRLEQSIQYILDGIIEIFAPNHDDYPNIGVQPFTGEFHTKFNKLKS